MKKTFAFFTLSIMFLVSLGFASACHCGDGKINVAGETCDYGVNLNGKVCTPLYGDSCTYCSSICKLTTVNGPYCGDGILQTDYEECDDGNVVDGDGCTANCTTETPEVPEFGTIISMLTALSALGIFFVVRRFN